MSTAPTEVETAGQRATTIDPRVAAGLQRVALEIRKRYEVNAGLGAAIAPTEQWVQRNSDRLAAGELPEVGDEDLVVTFVLFGSLAFASSLLPRQQWREAATSLTKLFSMPLVDFKARIEAQTALGAAARAAAIGGG